jgi:NTP pyrophosphatase (non-canonical NTP hydrolase)
MLSREQILVLLIEECGEVVQAATKCLRFGWDREQPDYGVNHEVLAKEIGDLLGAADALPLNNDLVRAFRKMKMSKAERAHAMFGVTS